jgi:ADP-ribose pyrophosphatase
MTTETIGLQDARRARYDALRSDRPGLFEGRGPIVLDADRDDAGTGVVHADPWIMLVVDPVVMPNGRPGRYVRLISSVDAEGVAILPITRSGRIWMLRHWRHATRSWHLEIPRGFGEAGLPPVGQASVELLEELDLSGTMTAIGHLHPDTGMQATRVALFVAEIDDDAAPAHREGLATVIGMTVREFEDAVMDGSITDPFALAAWTRWRILEARSDADRRV